MRSKVKAEVSELYKDKRRLELQIGNLENLRDRIVSECKGTIDYISDRSIRIGKKLKRPK